MIQVCCYKSCGVVYGEKEPQSDKNITHGLCPIHLETSLKEIEAKWEKRKKEEWRGNYPDHRVGTLAHRRPAHLAAQ